MISKQLEYLVDSIYSNKPQALYCQNITDEVTSGCFNSCCISSKCDCCSALACVLLVFQKSFFFT